MPGVYRYSINRISQIVDKAIKIGIPTPVNWDAIFPDIDVEYIADLPNYSRFWNEIERNSLVCIDDLWTAASNNEHVSNAFKVYSKKQGFSIIIVTQVSMKN